jgi:hypothetical protein
MAKRRSVQRVQPTVRHYLELAIHSGNPGFMEDLVESLKQAGLTIDLQVAKRVVTDAKKELEKERISRKPRGRS